MESCSSVAALKDRRLSTSSGADQIAVSRESCFQVFPSNKSNKIDTEPSDSNAGREFSRMMRIVCGRGRGFHSALLTRMKAFNRGRHVGIHHRSEVKGHELGE